MIQKKVLAGVAVVGLLAAAWAMMGRQTPGKALEQEPSPPAVTAPVSTLEAAPVPTPTPTPAPTPTPEPTATPQPLFELVSETRYTNTQANIRASYTVNSAKITTLPLNTELQVIGTGIANTEAEGWLKVEFNGKEAFISGSLTSPYKIEVQQPVKVDKPVQQPEQKAEAVLPQENVTVQQPVQQQPVEEPVETPDKGIDPSLPSAGSRFGDHTGLEGVPSDTDYSKYTIK